MARSEITGSWHNSGYHGHYRSKSRSDFIGEYRHLAKPAPPKSYITRSKEGPTKHVFSKHDNRHSFMNDALYFEQGLGRKRIPRNSNNWQPDFLTWMPMKKEMDVSGPKASLYKVSYRGIPMQPMKEQLVKRPKTSFDENLVDTTTYRYAHCGGNPNRATLNVMNNTVLMAKPERKAKTPSSFTGNSRESVASCLSWHAPSKGRTPEATQVTMPAATQTQPPPVSDATVTVQQPLAATQ